MKRKLTTLIMAGALILSGALASFADGPWSTAIGVGGVAVWDPPGVVQCAGSDTWHIRSYTFDFGPFDSTGGTTMRIQSGGTVYNKYYTNVEHDVVVREWNTGKKTGQKFVVDYSGLSSVGNASVSVACK